MVITTVSAFSQTFEGRVSYTNSYVSHTDKLTSEQLAGMMGTKQNYYIKGGNYKSMSNGELVQWQLYINKDNKLYNKYAYSEILMWMDGSDNTDSVLSVVVNRGVTEVLGYKCDEVIIISTSGKKTFYFNSKLGVDPKLFEQHLFGCWAAYTAAAKALPLKSIVEEKDFTYTSTATEVKAEKLEDSFFQLPKNVEVKSAF